MRTLAFIALTAGVLGTASAPTSAAQLVENFTIGVSGDADQHFLSSPFDLFDPSLGTLMGVSESVSGSLTWDFGDTGQTLLLVLAKTGASQFFFSSGAGGSQGIDVSLTGAGGFQDPVFIGLGTTPQFRAMSAFETMQTRLKRFVGERTHMLAAIAHYVRSPGSGGLVVSVLLPKALGAAPKRHRGLDSR